MYPILLTIGNFPVSSYGLFLALGIFFGSFTIWRIVRSFDFDAEKVLDVIFLTIGVGFILSRLIFVLMNLSVFNSISRIFFINRYPGLSFWGGLFGGLLALRWFSRRNERALSYGNKMSFLQACDIAIIGFFIAGFFTEIGCLLGACGVGLETTSVISIDQVGVIGKRIPVQLFESLAFLAVFFFLWKKILRFHIPGSFLSKGLIILGLIKLVAGFFKTPTQLLRIGSYSLNFDLILSITALLLGLYFHYKVNKKTPGDDLASFLKFFVSRQMQKSLMTKIIRGCYNQKANFTVGLAKGRKRLFKFLNIRSNPENFKSK